MARKSLILRESLAPTACYSYVKDEFLNKNANLSVYVNTYGQEEVLKFIEAYGFTVQLVTDEYTGGTPQQVIDG